MSVMEAPNRTQPDYREVMKHVRALHKEFGVEEPPVNPVAIARGSGVDVRFVEFDGDFDRVSGFYDPDENTIFVNKHEFPLRQTFTIAHELGHAILHRDWVRSDDYRVFWRDSGFDLGEVHEREANAFAAHLLAPRKLLDQYSHLPAQDLSRLFAVSVPMIKNRLSFEYGI